MKDTAVIVFYSSVRRAANENIKKYIVAICVAIYFRVTPIFIATNKKKNIVLCVCVCLLVGDELLLILFSFIVHICIYY